VSLIKRLQAAADMMATKKAWGSPKLFVMASDVIHTLAGTENLEFKELNKDYI
jgi:hypothetical protein